MKNFKSFFILLISIGLASAANKELVFNKPIVLTFKKLDGWSKWQKPGKDKTWKIESVWTSCHANTPDYFIQVNDVSTRHLYDEEFSSFWLSENDSIRISKSSSGFDFAISILEYNIIDKED